MQDTQKDQRQRIHSRSPRPTMTSHRHSTYQICMNITRQTHRFIRHQIRGRLFLKQGRVTQPHNSRPHHHQGEVHRSETKGHQCIA